MGNPSNAKALERFFNKSRYLAVKTAVFFDRILPCRHYFKENGRALGKCVLDITVSQRL